MTPTRWPALLAMLVVAGVVGFLLIDLRTGDLLELPYYAPVTAGVLGVFELVLARVVHDRVMRRNTRRAMHPLQVARAAVLAKASSSAGALLAGLYLGLLAWLVPRTDSLHLASHDSVVAAVSAGACLLLTVAGLLLERACLDPDRTAQQ